MRVGMYIPGMHPWDVNEGMVRLAEGAGVDSVWAPDHLLNSFHPQLWPEMSISVLSVDSDAWYDPFCVGAALSRSMQLPYGVAVTDAVRRGSVDVARSALTLQHLCPGGFNLGVGLGEAMSLRPFGYSAGQPGARCERFLCDLRSLLDTGRLPDGGVGRTGLPLRSERGKPRVWVAAHGPRMLRLTGQYGDGWLPAWTVTPEEYGERRDVIARHADAAGRPTPEAGLVVFMVIGESRDRVAQMLEDEPLAKLWALVATAEAWARHGLEHPAGASSRGFVDVVIHDLDPEPLRELAPRIPVELVEEVLFIGNARELADRFAEYARSGCQHLVFAFMTGLVGGMAEVQARIPALGALCQELRAM
jgi:phthiodiolone/phenolphthiodiolone dimycocerosates ketoreductase